MKTIRLFTGAKFLGVFTLGYGLAAARVGAADTGWFVTGDAGPSFVNTVNVTTSDLFGGPSTTTHFAFDPGIRLDAGVGYQFTPSWALDGEVGYIYNSADVSNSGTTASQNLYQVPFLLNVIYTLPVSWRIQPYVGAGLGGVVTGLDDMHDVNGAAQFIAGLKYRLNDWLDLGLGYKFLITTAHDWGDVLGTTESSSTMNNSIFINATFRF